MCAKSEQNQCTNRETSKHLKASWVFWVLPWVTRWFVMPKEMFDKNSSDESLDWVELQVLSAKAQSPTRLKPSRKGSYVHKVHWESCQTLWKHRKSAKLPWRPNIRFSFWSLSFVFLSFCLRLFCLFCLFVFLSRHHSDQMSDCSQVSKVTLCVNIQKWHSVTHSLTDWPKSGI